jgi:hypothetical protein
MTLLPPALLRARSFRPSQARPMNKPVQSSPVLGGESETFVVRSYCVSRWIYEVTGPRYALFCFVTHVETRSPPVFTYYNDIISHMGTVRGSSIPRADSRSRHLRTN